MYPWTKLVKILLKVLLLLKILLLLAENKPTELLMTDFGQTLEIFRSIKSNRYEIFYIASGAILRMKSTPYVWGLVHTFEVVEVESVDKFRGKESSERFSRSLN